MARVRTARPTRSGVTSDHRPPSLRSEVAAHELYFTRHGLLALIVAEDGWGAQSVEADRLLTEAHADAELHWADTAPVLSALPE